MAQCDRASSVRRRGNVLPMMWAMTIGLAAACERGGGPAPAPPTDAGAPTAAAPQPAAANAEPASNPKPATEPAITPADPPAADPPAADPVVATAGDPALVERILADYHRIERFFPSRPEDEGLSKADEKLLRKWLRGNDFELYESGVHPDMVRK